MDVHVDHDEARDTAVDAPTDDHVNDAPIRLAGSHSGDRHASDVDVTDDEPLFADIDDLGSRWTDIQAAFVDDPRHAIENADALVADVMDRVTRRLTEQRELLEGTWRRGEEASTEDLRVALQHYRSFFQRLLAA